MSGFFSSQRPIESPRDHRTSVRRKTLQPLHERSPSRNNQQIIWTPDPEKPTVRLVKPSPPSQNDSSDSDEYVPTLGETGKENRQEGARLQASVSKPGFRGSAASSQDNNVSDIDDAANEAQGFSSPDSHSLLSANPIHASAGLETQWHRRSGSTGNYSTSSTLKESEASIFGGQKSIGGDSSRLSQGTTLRGTPTPYEQEHRERIEEEASAVRRVSVTELETLPEASPEQSTVRVVPQSVGSDSSEHRLPSQPSESSIVVRPQSSSDSEQRPPVPRRNSRRRSSASSTTAPLNTRNRSASLTPRNRRSEESIAQSEATLPASSSPNFVAYTSSSPRPRSGTHPLHSSYSIESIQSRLQYATLARPDTGRSVATSSSWASFGPSSSADTLPPLQVPKKRLRHKPASLSLNQAARSGAYASGSSMAGQEDYDTLPYPREPFSSHLSTIASESDRQSRATSQQLSHFSLGSGVLTGDDSSSIPFSGTWPRRRRESAPIDSIVSDSSPGAPGTSSEEEPGDMTLGVFREHSAMPQPLFLPRSQGSPRSLSSPGAPRVYEGPMPPLPPIPKDRDSEEHVDKVSELHPPPLREKRSGYSLRRRSNSTPSRSHSHSRHMSQVSRSEEDRWSHASSIFPAWAKQFYGHGATLMSASKVSLGTHSTPQQSRNGPPGMGNGHGRNNSTWTERSITSRLGTGYNEIEDEATSPTSSHFLPSIFRPRTRGRANTDGNSRGSRRLQKKGKRNQPSNPDENGRDSMGIFSDPLPESRSGANTAETLPSGQPKWGQLKDNVSEQHRPLPRKYSKQKKWDQMEFPRPMTKDRLSDFHDMSLYDPRLAPTARASRQRLSIWRAPSFVESLDTLWRSRCNRQILLFALGFIFPPCWLLGAILPIPKKPMTAAEYEKERNAMGAGASEEDIQAAMMKHEAGDAEKRYREERSWAKGRWWRMLNRVMSVVGVLVIGAVIALAIVATTH